MKKTVIFLIALVLSLSCAGTAWADDNETEISGDFIPADLGTGQSTEQGGQDTSTSPPPGQETETPDSPTVPTELGSVGNETELSTEEGSQRPVSSAQPSDLRPTAATPTSETTTAQATVAPSEAAKELPLSSEGTDLLEPEREEEHSTTSGSEAAQTIPMSHLALIIGLTLLVIILVFTVSKKRHKRT